jgi:phosphate transport system ATP-binding protein
VQGSKSDIYTERLEVAYGETVALCDVTLLMPAGQITAIVGPSGCGKSSFLAALNRMTETIPGCRTSGEVHIGSKRVDQVTDLSDLRRRVGMIFQKPNPFPMSVLRNLTFPLREHGADPQEAKSAAEQALRSVGLWDEVSSRLDTPARSLSGGQQQRLCIARALALTPEVILLDEPCSALDPISSAVVEDLIVSLKDRYTVVTVTHNLAQARRIADRVAVFWIRDGSGRLIEHGTTEQIFEHPSDPLTAAYINEARG